MICGENNRLVHSGPCTLRMSLFPMCACVRVCSDVVICNGPIWTSGPDAEEAGTHQRSRAIATLGATSPAPDPHLIQCHERSGRECLRRGRDSVALVDCSNDLKTAVREAAGAKSGAVRKPSIRRSSAPLIVAQQRRGMTQQTNCVGPSRGWTSRKGKFMSRREHFWGRRWVVTSYQHAQGGFFFKSRTLQGLQQSTRPVSFGHRSENRPGSGNQSHRRW